MKLRPSRLLYHLNFVNHELVTVVAVVPPGLTKSKFTPKSLLQPLSYVKLIMIYTVWHKTTKGNHHQEIIQWWEHIVNCHKKKAWWRKHWPLWRLLVLFYGEPPTLLVPLIVLQSNRVRKRKKRAFSGSIDVVVAASLVTSEEATPLLLLLVPLQVSCVQSLEPRDPCKYLFLGHT